MTVHSRLDIIEEVIRVTWVDVQLQDHLLVGLWDSGQSCFEILGKSRLILQPGHSVKYLPALPGLQADQPPTHPASPGASLHPAGGELHVITRGEGRNSVTVFCYTALGCHLGSVRVCREKMTLYFHKPLIEI